MGLIANAASATSIVQNPSVECCASRTGAPRPAATQPVSFHPEIPSRLKGVVRNATARSNQERGGCASRESRAIAAAASQGGVASGLAESADSRLRQ